MNEIAFKALFCCLRLAVCCASIDKCLRKPSQKAWYQRNRDRLIKKSSEYKRNNRERRRVSNNTWVLIGCTYDFFRRWMEIQFDASMTWYNLGLYWVIDNVLPVAAFDLTVERHQVVAFQSRIIRQRARSLCCHTTSMLWSVPCVSVLTTYLKLCLLSSEACHGSDQGQ